MNKLANSTNTPVPGKMVKQQNMCAIEHAVLDACCRPISLDRFNSAEVNIDVKFDVKFH